MSTREATHHHAIVEHEHGESCGHVTPPHGDHVDFAHDGHRHGDHEGHWDEH